MKKVLVIQIANGGDLKLAEVFVLSLIGAQFDWTTISNSFFFDESGKVGKSPTSSEEEALVDSIALCTADKTCRATNAKLVLEDEEMALITTIDKAEGYVKWLQD